MAVLAVVTAAGSGLRLGFDIPKALVQLQGEPLVLRAVRGALDVGVDAVVVTAPMEHLETFTNVFANHEAVSVVAGGSVRQESVYRGLLELPRLAERLGLTVCDTTPVLIHDAARCLTPGEVFQDVIAALERGLKAVIPAVAVTDTQKIVAPTAHQGVQKVVGQVDRTALRAVQTPQGFHFETIMRAHEVGREISVADAEITDDAGLVEYLGEDVFVTEGSYLALKITTKLDLLVARELLVSGI